MYVYVLLKKVDFLNTYSLAEIFSVGERNLAGFDMNDVWVSIIPDGAAFLLSLHDNHHGNLRYPPKATPPINKALLRGY